MNGGIFTQGPHPLGSPHLLGIGERANFAFPSDHNRTISFWVLGGGVAARSWPGGGGELLPLRKRGWGDTPLLGRTFEGFEYRGEERCENLCRRKNKL